MDAPISPQDATRPDQLSWTIRRVGARLRWIEAGALLAWAAAAFVAYVAAAALADHALADGLPLGVRRAGALLAGIAIGVTLLVSGRRILSRPLNELYLARLLERRYPELRHLLLTALQLSERGEIAEGVRAGLAEGASLLSQRCDPAEAIAPRPALRGAAGCAAILAALLIYAAVSPKPIGPALLRALGRDIPPATLTRIESFTPEAGASFVRGEPAPVELQCSGRIPREALVECRPADTERGGEAVAAEPGDAGDSSPDASGTSSAAASTAAPRRALLDPAPDDRTRWRGMLPSGWVERPLLLRVLAGDARSDWRRIDVRPRPEAALAAVTYRFPAYMGRDAARSTEPFIDGPAGARVEIEVRSNVPVERGSIRYRDAFGASARQLEPQRGDSARLGATWVLEQDAAFQFVLRDRLGAESAEGVTYRQRVRPDRAPEVLLRSPAEDGALSAASMLDVTAEASDDYGLTSAQVVFSNRGVGGRIEIPVRAAAGRRQRLVAQVAASALGARPGETVELWVEACDNRHSLMEEPAFQVGRSAVRRLTLAEMPPQQLADAGRSRDRIAMGKGEATPGREGAAEGSNGSAPAEGHERGADAARGTDRGEDGASPGMTDAKKGDAGGNEKSAAARQGEAGEKPGAKDSDDAGKGDDKTSDQSDKPGSDGSGGSDEKEEPSPQPLSPGERGEKGDGDAGDLESFVKEHRKEIEQVSRRTSDDAKKGERGAEKPGEQGQPKGEGGAAPQQGEESDSQENEGAPKSDAPLAGTGGAKTGGEGSQPGGEGESEGGAGKSGGGENSKERGGRAEGAGGAPMAPGNSDGSDPNGGAGAANGNDSGSARGSGAAGAAGGAGDQPGAAGKESSNASGNKSGKQSDQDSGAAGGDSPSSSGATGGSSSSTARGGAGGGDAPRTPAPPPEDAAGRFAGEGDSAGLNAEVGRAARAVDALEQSLRPGSDGRLLAELGWERARAEQFVREYRRRESADRRNRDRSRGAEAATRGGLPGEAGLPGDSSLRAGGDARATRGDGAIATESLDRTRPLLEDGRPEEAPPEYRALLEAYYREMARE